MSESIVREIIETHLNSFWGSTSPVDWDGIEFTPVIGTPFIVPRWECVASANVALRCERNHYLLSIKINTPADEGQVENLTFADLIKENFINRGITGMIFRQGRVLRRGEVNEWYQREVLIECFYDNKY